MQYSSLYRRKQKIGNCGEDFAEKFLHSKGFFILERNKRIGKGEIDFIVQDQKTIVFVEVKTRHNTNFGDAISAVTRQKFHRIQKCAQKYIIMHQITHYRFDIIGITVRSDCSLRELDYSKDIVL